ncbi:uncharacterized protein METZ01_LOCUS226609 [marine metagenome]|uniref:Uncharacterized protein n=1 Tax=marine metagenome TaxID=408172 RepID=A0A382GG82_9ZZZZ
MGESNKTDDRDHVSALARSILKHIQVEGGNNIPLATAACGSVAMYLLAVSTTDENEQERFFLGLRNELLAFNKARVEGDAKPK